MVKTHDDYWLRTLSMRSLIRGILDGGDANDGGVSHDIADYRYSDAWIGAGANVNVFADWMRALCITTVPEPSKHI